MMSSVENSKAPKTSVWWDIENCEVPRGWDAHPIAKNVTSALLNMNYCGNVSILAYGDTNLIPHHVQQALSSTGVGLNHVPAGVKDASDKKILVDMLLWAIDNPAPANIMLISGDRDFSNALHQLSMRTYTILLAHPPRPSAPLVSAAKNVWLWTSLAAGGPPITSDEESSQQVNNGNCNGSYPVPEPTGSSSVSGHTNVTSSDSFRAHLSDKKHVSQAAFVANQAQAHASVSVKPIQEASVVEPVLCTVCQISCISKEVYARHIYGKRHRNNLELQPGKVENVSKQKATGGRTRPNAGYACRLCNVKCQSQVVYDSHLKGRKHAAMLSQLDQTLIAFNSLRKESVGEKSQPRETIAEPQLQSQENTKCFEKHVAMVNQAEKGAKEKSQPIELHSLNTQEKTRCLEKKSEELRELLLDTSKSSVKEKFLRAKDQAETVNKQLLNEEARECSDSTVKPVNKSEEATDNHSVEGKKKQKEVMERRAVQVRHKLCHLCVVICDSQGVSTLVCGKKYLWPNQMAAFVASDDDSVWCQVCKISFNSKAAYANHTYGKKHRQKLELQSAENENMSKGQAKTSEENAEMMRKSKDQTAFDSLNHAVTAKDQTEKASVDSRRTRQELDTHKLREESDQGEQEVKEEVKEINAISENLVHVFNGMNRESGIPKESRGCLDVIPERVQVPPDVNVTGKFEDESKHKQEREKECAGGGKEHPGEAAKTEESKKVQVDSLWTRLWWGKS